MTTPRKTFRILCINGGGMLGIMPARVLQHLETVSGQPLSEMFDLICGTSVGAVIAGVIASPSDIHIGDAIDKLKNTKMFKSSLWKNVITVGGILGPRISTTMRDQEMATLYGDVTLKECSPDVLTVSQDISHQRSKIFTSKRNGNVLIKDAVIASASIPTIWKEHQVEDALCIDGGFLSNNPMLYGITEALTTYGQSPENLAVLSLGTGYLVDEEISASPVPRSLTGFRLVNTLIRTLASANTMNSFDITSSLVPNMERFVHLDFPLHLHQFKFLSTKKSDVDALEHIAEQVIHDNESVLERFGKMLTGEMETSPEQGRLFASQRKYYTNVKNISKPTS